MARVISQANASMIHAAPPTSRTTRSTPTGSSVRRAARARALTWAESADGTACNWLWECTAGSFRWWFAMDETVHIVEGSVTVAGRRRGADRRSASATRRTSRPGRWSTWTVDEYVRKHAVLRVPVPGSMAYLVNGFGRRRHAVKYPRPVRRFATVLLVDPRGWLLLQERDEHAPIDPERWGLVGGHVEDGEDVEHAVHRELAEETGLPPGGHRRRLTLWRELHRPRERGHDGGLRRRDDRHRRRRRLRRGPPDRVRRARRRRPGCRCRRPPGSWCRCSSTRRSTPVWLA